MLIQGDFYRCGSASSHPATLESAGHSFRIQAQDGSSSSGNLSDIQVSERLGNVERKLTLANGDLFATRDNDAVDSLFSARATGSGFIHTLESHIGWAAIALVVAVTVAISFFRWGVPWISTTVAHALPQETNEFISRGTLEFLDDHFFDESELDQVEKDRIRERFQSSLLALEEESNQINYKIHFRNWVIDEKAIPNAFALPAGDIILTDKFVQLAQHQDEIDAVLLHEMAHVVHRHSLESVVSGGLVAAIIMIITGDNSAIVDVGLGVGSLLISSNYSRENEIEADLYAFQKMLDAGIDPNAFSEILNRMNAYMEDFDGEETSNENADEAEYAEDNSEPKSNILDYLSSHPSTQLRAEQARRYSECFKRSENPCEPAIE